MRLVRNLAIDGLRPWRRTALVAALVVATTEALFAAYQLRPEGYPNAAPVTATAAAQTIGRFVLHDAPRPLPDIEFADADGAVRRLSDFRGKVVLLNVWATWCVPCRKEMPQLDQLQAEFGGADFEVVAVSIDRGGAFVVQAFYDEIDVQHLKMFIDASGAVSRALNIVGLPTTLLIDRQGRELGRLIGPTDWTGPEIKKLIQRTIARRETARGGISSAAPPSST